MNSKYSQLNDEQDISNSSTCSEESDKLIGASDCLKLMEDREETDLYNELLRSEFIYWVIQKHALIFKNLQLFRKIQMSSWNEIGRAHV